MNNLGLILSVQVTAEKLTGFKDSGLLRECRQRHRFQSSWSNQVSCRHVDMMCMIRQLCCRVLQVELKDLVR